MQIVYNLPHVFYPGSNRADNAAVLRAMLDMLIRVNISYLKSMRKRGHAVPPLYGSGVVYARTVWWEPIPALYERGWGDCKSLTCAKVAEDYLKGIKTRAVFRFNPKPNSTDYHILQQTASGYHDPSKVLGMGQDENAWFRI